MLRVALQTHERRSVWLFWGRREGFLGWGYWNTLCQRSLQTTNVQAHIDCVMSKLCELYELCVLTLPYHHFFGQKTAVRGLEMQKINTSGETITSK